MKLRFAFTTAGLLAVVGCASLFGVDGYSDSTEELCELLERCYQVKDCRDRLGPRLDAASASERSDWLSAISDQASSSAARRDAASTLLPSAGRRRRSARARKSVAAS